MFRDIQPSKLILRRLQGLGLGWVFPFACGDSGPFRESVWP